MYKELILFRNELKNKNVSRYKLIGIIAEVLFSKEIFPKNKDIIIFMKQVFGLELKGYILKSRTMVVSKVIKYMTNSPDANIDKKELLNFINMKIEYFKEKENIHVKKNDFDGWLS